MKKVHTPWRYFFRPNRKLMPRSDTPDDDIVTQIVMTVNTSIAGALVFSSGRNIGVFKASGWPEEVADFYRVQDYEGYLWIAHNRYPTNTSGWWGGAHPFNLLNWSVVHNGEITSYGTNRRYIESFGMAARCIPILKFARWILPESTSVTEHGPSTGPLLGKRSSGCEIASRNQYCH